MAVVTRSPNHKAEQWHCELHQVHLQLSPSGHQMNGSTSLGSDELQTFSDCPELCGMVHLVVLDIVWYFAMWIHDNLIQLLVIWTFLHCFTFHAFHAGCQQELVPLFQPQAVCSATPPKETSCCSSRNLFFRPRASGDRSMFKLIIVDRSVASTSQVTSAAPDGSRNFRPFGDRPCNRAHVAHVLLTRRHLAMSTYQMYQHLVLEESGCLRFSSACSKPSQEPPPKCANHANRFMDLAKDHKQIQNDSTCHVQSVQTCSNT